MLHENNVQAKGIMFLTKGVRNGGGVAVNTSLEFDTLQKLYCLRKGGNWSDVVMSVFHSPVTRSLILLQLWTAVQ